MPIKSIFAPHLGYQVKLGRKRPVSKGFQFKLKNYLVSAAVAPPPASVNYAAKAAGPLSNVYLNDQLGDCVIAGGYHVVALETGNASGSPWVASSAQIIKDYSAIGGYVPGDPNTDQGCDLVTALNYWTSHGFANGSKLVGWMAVDATNKTEVMQAMYLFENLYLGMELPDAWVNPFPAGSGFTWNDGPPDPNNGHCVMGVGYSPQGILIDTWGLIGTLTYQALAHLCSNAGGGELYVMLTPDQLAKGQTKAPNGFAWADLISDFDAMGGNVPVPPAPTPPVPQPPPPPPPAPSPKTATLAEAIQWATAGLTNHWPK